jgi:hypothetical protein
MLLSWWWVGVVAVLVAGRGGLHWVVLDLLLDRWGGPRGDGSGPSDAAAIPGS